jgi:MFS family permease
MASALAPFRHRTYAVLWAATVLANVGTWMYSAAAGWLMTTLDSRPLMVAMVQAATTLPMFLFALPAGALADIVDTRRFLIVVEAAIIVVSVPLAFMVERGAMTATLLLAFTFVIEAGAAMAAPAWQSIVPHLVPREDLPAAVAANSVGVNISRALGPALGGVFAAALGPAAPFWFNAFSNVGSITALALARVTEKRAHSLPAERFAGAIRAGLRHARNNPPLRATLWRASVFFFFASSYWALLPLLAHDQIRGGPQLYGMLLGAIGIGAIASAAILPRLEARLGAGRLVSFAQAGTAVALALFAVARDPVLAVAASLLAGACWIAGVSRLNVSSQMSLPDWVRARGLAVHVSITFGAMTLGSIAWGELAGRIGLAEANLLAAAGALLTIPLTLRWRLATGGVDQAPSMHWPAPIVSGAIEADQGPVLVSVEYRVAPAAREEFLAACEAVARQRRRNGAYAWQIFEDTADPGRFVETFQDESWLENIRKHDRVTHSDGDNDRRVRAFASGEPRVTHFVAARAANGSGPK